MSIIIPEYNEELTMYLILNELNKIVYSHLIVANPKQWHPDITNAKPFYDGSQK